MGSYSRFKIPMILIFMTFLGLSLVLGQVVKENDPALKGIAVYLMLYRF